MLWWGHALGVLKTHNKIVGVVVDQCVFISRGLCTAHSSAFVWANGSAI